MTELLVSGRKQSAFHVTFEFKDDADREAFENSDIFDWLEQSRGIGERTAVLVSTVFPAVLGDMMHCFYEALETSRKGKLTVSFMLLRKPLQESLFLLESVLVDPHGFAEKMTVDPGKLGSQGAGGLEVHTNTRMGEGSKVFNSVSALGVDAAKKELLDFGGLPGSKTSGV
jgi:hypothetical protein